MDKNKELIKADDLGLLPDSTGSNYLPKPVADKVIEQLKEENFMRRMFPSIPVPRNARNITIPAVLYDANNVRTIGYGTDVTGLPEQTVTVKSIVLSPRLLTAWVEMLEDDIETASIDLLRTMRETLTKQLSEAEFRAMLFGVYNSASGTYLNVFNGIYTIAAGADCATSPITYTDSDKLSFKVMDAKKALGLYGNNASNLVLICSSTFAIRLRKEDVVYNQSIRTDSDVLKTGTLPPIAGVPVIETTHLDEKENGEVAILIRKDAMVIGERKNIFFRTVDVPEKFAKQLLIAEEIDFKPQLVNGSDKYEGIVLIHKAS
ncbi:MAG: phage major capsid protein [Candidatus Thorarchaeota archaeon]|nr:MAG: phage major capsid protein [Candidatus Thorarchaeota archaeon]